MPQKKVASKSAKTAEVKQDSDGTKAKSSAKQEDTERFDSKASHAASGSSKKRKAQDSTAKEPSKAARKSSRGAPSEPVDPVRLINYFLSPDSLALCRPKDESSDLENRGKGTRAYSTSIFTPFEELVCALILSRPIGHMLGLRSIRTLFNDPHNLDTPKAIRAAGREGCRLALDQARTQHRQKTAEELVLFADAVVDHLGKGEDDTSLERVREVCGYDAGKQREMLQKHVKGMGKTGVDIFARRIQQVWKEWYPFADQRTLQATEKLGLAADVEELRKIVDDRWAEIDMGTVEGKDEDEKKRKVFVRVLERAVGCDLEGSIDEVRKAVV
ncbi:MAG: hypothetical protein Q9217_005463 [Psora testacea]